MGLFVFFIALSQTESVLKELWSIDVEGTFPRKDSSVCMCLLAWPASTLGRQLYLHTSH